MSPLNFEIARCCLVIGLVATAYVYSRTRISSGGAITGSYLAFLALSGAWADIAGWFVLAFVGLGAMRAVAARWPLSRTWLYYLAVIIPAGVHLILAAIGSFPDLGVGLSAILVAGLYVTNGLTAYDMQRQGIGKTLLAVAVVTTFTTAVVWVVMQFMPSGTTAGISYFTPHEPLLIFICILAAAAVHLALGWGSAGIIGGLFLIDVLNFQTIVLLVAISYAAAFIARWASTRMSLSPRQRLYSILIVGAIVSWFGLFWLDWLGLNAAAFQSQFGVDTLLVIGLMTSEIVRLGAARAYGGSAIVITLTALATWAMSDTSTLAFWTIAAIFATIGVLLWWGIRSQRDIWHHALVAGDRWAVLGITEQRKFLRGGLMLIDDDVEAPIHKLKRPQLTQGESS